MRYDSYDLKVLFATDGCRNSKISVRFESQIFTYRWSWWWYRFKRKPYLLLFFYVCEVVAIANGYTNLGIYTAKT